MVQDARWPALPVLVLRGFQLFFTILVLGMSGYLVSATTAYGFYSGTFWGYAMTVTAAVFTLIYIPITFVLFYMNLLLPLAIVIVDAVLLVFWVISLGGLADSRFLPESCEYKSASYTGGLFDLDYTYTTVVDVPCRVTKAAFGVSFLLFLAFIGTLVIASITLHKNRKDLRGAKYNSGLDPQGNPLPQPGVAVAMGDVPGAPPTTYYQEPKQNYEPNPQTTAATPGYYDYQHQQQQVVSPPATPAPYMPPQGMPQPPPNAAELGGR